MSSEKKFKRRLSIASAIMISSAVVGGAATVCAGGIIQPMIVMAGGEEEAQELEVSLLFKDEKNGKVLEDINFTIYKVKDDRSGSDKMAEGVSSNQPFKTNLPIGEYTLTYMTPYGYYSKGYHFNITENNINFGTWDLTVECEPIKPDTLNVKIVDMEGNEIRGANIDVTVDGNTISGMGENARTVNIDNQNPNITSLYDFNLSNLTLPDGYIQPIHPITHKDLFNGDTIFNIARSFTPGNDGYLFYSSDVMGINNGLKEPLENVVLEKNTDYSYNLTIRIEKEEGNETEETDVEINQEIKNNHISEFEVKFVDTNGNEIKGASVDIDFQDFETEKRKTQSVSSAEKIVSIGDISLSNMKVPEGYSVPKYDGTDEELFNSTPLIAGLNISTLDMEIVGKYGTDKLSSVKVESKADGYGGGGAPMPYLLTITLAQGNEVKYYNSIGGNKAGEADTKIDDEYVLGSGETVILIFKRFKNDSETFSHFTWLEYSGPNVGKEYDPRLNDDYYIEPGSVQVKLTAKYLEQLGVGTHIFNAHFDDSTLPVEAKVKVVDKKESGKNQDVNQVTSTGNNASSGSKVKAQPVFTGSSSPVATKAAATGVGGDIALWTSIAATTGAVISGSIIRRKKK